MIYALRGLMLELSFYFALNFDPSSTRTEIEGGKKKRIFLLFKGITLDRMPFLLN